MERQEQAWALAVAADFLPTPPGSPKWEEAADETGPTAATAMVAADPVVEVKTEEQEEELGVEAMEPSNAVPAVEPPSSPKPEGAAAGTVEAAGDANIVTTTAAGKATAPLVVKAEPPSPAAELAASARLAKPGGFVEYNRSVPFWAKMTSFLNDLGLRKVKTRHADRNLCLCFAALVSADEMYESEQR